MVTKPDQKNAVKSLRKAKNGDMAGKVKNNDIYQRRLQSHIEELKWLYMELYDHSGLLDDLLINLHEIYKSRGEALKQLDLKRESQPGWYKKSNMTGMMMYADNYANTLQGVNEKLDYIENCRIRFLHLMPLLKSPAGRSDGGYAVSDFRSVKEELGTMEDLRALADQCHSRGISLCLDFVMNHTSEEHEWARRARSGEQEYRDRYFFFDNSFIPAVYEKTVPQVFPATAPGNFTRLPESGNYVMTTFYPYQWDLNYRNPVVFNEMMYNFLFLANQGIDILRIDAVPYIWKQTGTSCRNLPQVHTIVRMMRIITEIVCPGVALLGEVVMEPDKVVPYFGTVEKPECHMLYNVTTMAATWNSVATKDVRLLKRQTETVSRLPSDYVFLNYLRCHDDIGWGLDYPVLKSWGMEETVHKRFLNQYFTGQYPKSPSRGQLYNEDHITGDARFCGTTASMCGIESKGFENDEAGMEKALMLMVMLHGYLLFQAGIPMLYSGDEIGQLNDYGYEDDPFKIHDSRYLHRGPFPWELVPNINRKGTVQNRLFPKLQQLMELRAAEEVFSSSVSAGALECWDDAVLCLVKEDSKSKAVGVFNFSPEDKMAWIDEQDGIYTDMVTGEMKKASGLGVRGYGFHWLIRHKEQ